jgi:uncharacterized protein YbjT (DUF2867 family)
MQSSHIVPAQNTTLFTFRSHPDFIQEPSFLIMSPTFLVVGATGNTGRAVAKTLSDQLEVNRTFSGHRILALTRSSKSAAAQELAGLPHVEVAEYSWPEITPAWFREHDVTRAFIASHNEPTHFAKEYTFHHAALRAVIKYVVRISTTAANVHPDCDAYYPRAHWAIKAMLSSPEFKNLLHWTSLQPNIFLPLYLSTPAELVKKIRSGDKQETLRLIASAEGPVAPIEPEEVGIVAAHLLLQEDTAKYNQDKLVLNGPEDITGNELVKMVEKQTGAKVEDVSFKDVSFINHMAAQANGPNNIILSIKYAPVTVWEGLCTASTTSKEVLELAAPKRMPADVFAALLA